MSPGWISRVTVDLAAQQNEDAGCYGKDGQNRGQAAHRNERAQSGENEPYAQQQEANIFSEIHDDLLS
jgi:hypothetical protein